MASDLSSGCTEVIEILDEKEEGEISLEDVSSSEEGQLNDGCSSRRRAAGQCPSCLSTKHCASWCAVPTRSLRSKGSTKKDAVQEKENCHNTKDSGYSGSKHPASTLQENNNDLIPISSDSDMEIVGLADNVKQITLPAKSAKVRKRKRKRRSQNAANNAGNAQDLSGFLAESSVGTKRDSQVLKDNHLPRVHHRESNSPHKPLGSTFTRSRMAKSPLRRHRSPILRKSPIRRPRSPPRRSPIESPPRSPTRRPFRTSLSPSNPQLDTHGNVNKLLKKVRQLRTLGTHSANRSSGRRETRGASLKDKLNNMMKGSDAGKDNGDKKYSENEDEEDLALLRKMALETKPKRNAKEDGVSEAREETGCENNNGDEDVEDLELRMIALRSAMLKKHKDRMERGVLLGRTRKPADLTRSNTESPFSQSFLDSIPIPGEDNDANFTTPPTTPIQGLNENTNPEDMELDSEVELEKEKEEEPYSPTDDVSRQITIDAELLGIQASDVTFANRTSQAAIAPSFQGIQAISENDSLHSSQATYYSCSNVLPSSQSPTSSLYSPSNATDALGIRFDTRSDVVPAAPYSPSQPIETPDIYFSPQDNPFFHSEVVQIPDTPYSPTDTPLYDIELNAPPHFHGTDRIVRPQREKESTKNRNSKHQSALIQIDLTSTNVARPPDSIVAGDPRLTEEVLPSAPCPDKIEADQDQRSETSSMMAEIGSAMNSSANSPEDTMIAVDDLPETDLDGSPLVFELRDIEIHIPASSMTQDKSKLVQEPLYLLGVPDVTKDANKIPTLVNRSLVPASILKSNKNLQQPLPQKKADGHLEPAFRSAHMQPVQISTEATKTNTMFKPLKLAPVIKKPQLRIVTPAAFNCSSSDNSVMEDKERTEIVRAQLPLPTCRNETNNPSEDVQAPSKTWETTEAVQLGNSMKITEPILPVPEPRTSAVQEKGKKTETPKLSNKPVNSGKAKRTRSRRRCRYKNRSKNVLNVSKGSAGEGTGSGDTKQTPNSSKTNQKHGSDDSVEKRRSSREKLKKPDPDKSKRDRDERRDRRSEYKSDRASNSHKKTDANKPEEHRTETSKQQKVTEVIDCRKTTQDDLASLERRGDSTPEKIDDSNAKHSEADSQAQENTEGSNAANNPASTGQETEDSTSKSTECKKLEASKRRRSSLDDDEEALRAILLASLAKRSKPSEPANTAQKTPLADLSLTSVNTSTESAKGLPNTPGPKVPVNSVYSSSSDGTPPSLGQTNSTMINSSTKNVNSSSSVLQAETASPTIAESIVPRIATPDQAAAAMPLRKRSISASSKAPLKKIAKKAPISASTKVVNNAKKYQNTLVQKKLNLQKVAITNIQKSLSRTNLHGNKIMDTGRTRSMITQPLSDTQRFVINLASDSESENEIEPPTRNVEETISTKRPEPKPALAIPMSEFEKSVDLFLKDVRKKQENAAAVKPSLKSPGTQKPANPATPVHRKSPTLSTTPLAVRHLPVSLQEEYRRLKQQILEREKLKLHRVLVNNAGPLSPSSKSSGTPPGPLSPASPIHSPTMSKQSQNAPASSLSPMATSPKDSTRSVTVHSTVKTVVSSATTKIVSPVVAGKANSPSIASIPNLSIQIPNETANFNLGFKKSINSHIPVSNSQTRLVTAVNVTVNTKDSNSQISVKDQSGLKNVQVQLKQGKTGRTVSLGDNLNLNAKTSTERESEAQEPPTTKTLNVNSGGTDENLGSTPPSDSNKPKLDSPRVDDKCHNSVDSAASTLIISRNEENGKNDTLPDSSTSTVIIPRNENFDGGAAGPAAAQSSQEKAETGSKKLKNNTETWEKVRGDVRKELDAIAALPSSEQKTYLATVEQNLVKKRYAILDDLSEISGNLRQLKMEKEVQSNMVAEVKKLREQLKLAEERLETQRARVSKMAPSISATYEKVNCGRRECVKMTRICLGLGCQVVGSNYKVPAAGAQLLNNRLKQVAGSTRQLSNKKNSGNGEKAEEPMRTDALNQTSSSDNSQNETTSSTICENSTEGEETVTIGTLAVASQENSNCELALSIEADKTDIGDEDTLKIDRTVAPPANDSIPKDSPRQTSTPNSSKQSLSGEAVGRSAPKFVLDSQRAGISVNNKDGTPDQRRIFQPYKSVLEHLTVPRTADPSGILCPYELMGTCRDEDCNFVHQSARNG